MSEHLPVILGIGNEFRSDDGAGIYAVRLLENKFPANAVYRYFQEDVLSLIPYLTANSSVCIVDTVQSGKAPGHLHKYDLTKDLSVFSGLKFSGHSFGIIDAVQLAAMTAPLPGSLVFYGVEGGNFANGRDMTDAVRQGADLLALQIAAEVIT